MDIKEMLFWTVRAQVCGAESILDESISEQDMSSLYELSKKHDLAHIVAAELEAQGKLKDGDGTADAFRKQQLLAVYRYERINYEYEALCDALESIGVPFVSLKGSVIRRLYPEKWMRTSCDIDILVHEEDLDTAARYMTELMGYENKGKTSHDISLYSSGGVHVELHFSLIEDGVANNCNEQLKDVWSHTVPVGQSAYHFEFSDEMFYFYHIAHMAKHFSTGGCGIKPFVDLWILENRAEHSDESRNALLSRGGLLTFADNCRKLTQAWFSQGETSDLLSLMEAYILSGGVYGTLGNKVVFEQGKRGSKLKYIMSRLFLPYDSLKHSYPVIKKHRWLMPLCWIHRMFRLIFKKGTMSRSVSELRHSGDISKKDTQNAGAFLERIGL